MGKSRATSWLTAVKRAFRSPTKDNEKRDSTKRREEHEHEQEDEDQKKRGKRRWVFRKPSTSTNQETIKHHCEKSKTIIAPVPLDANKQRHALAVAMATSAARAAAATAQAAAEVVRLSGISHLVRRHVAAVAIQTAFRGYLARRALGALKGLVKLQALVRGHNVRKRAKLTLQCMEALMKVQARVRDQRHKTLLSPYDDDDQGTTGSIVSSGTNSTKYISQFRNMSGHTDDDWAHWNYDHQQAFEDIKAMLEETNLRGLALTREKDSVACPFSNQRSAPSRETTYASEGELEERPRWSRRNQHWNNRRASCDHYYRDPSSLTIPIKTVEMDTSLPHSYSSTSPNPIRPHRPSFYSTCSPITTPRRSLQVHSDSPRLIKVVHGSASMPIPSYMAATESAKARSRSYSAPRQRSPSRETEKTVRKRLSFPAPREVVARENDSTVHEYNLMLSPNYACNTNGAYQETFQY